MSELKTTDRQLLITDDEGKETACTILFTFHSDQFKKDYVIFYPSDQEESDEIELNAASYVEGDDGLGELEDIESDEEWEMIENALDHFTDELEEDEEYDLEEDCDDDDCEHCCHHDHEEEE